MALPFVVIQADRRRGVSSKEVVLIVFSWIDKLSSVLLTITR